MDENRRVHLCTGGRGAPSVPYSFPYYWLLATDYYSYIRPHRSESCTRIRMQNFRENLSAVNNARSRSIEIRIPVNDKHAVCFYGGERIPLWLGHEG